MSYSGYKSRFTGPQIDNLLGLISSGQGFQAVRRYEFEPSLEWLVDHGMNTTQFVERVTSSDGLRFNAKVEVVDENRFRVCLTEAVGGYVDVIFNAA